MLQSNPRVHRSGADCEESEDVDVLNKVSDVAVGELHPSLVIL